MPGEGDQGSEWQQSGQPHGNGHKGKNPPGEGDAPREGPSLKPGESKGSPKESSDSGNKRRSGLFSIEFVNSTIDDQRSHYKRDEHKILINLDHPQIALALKQAGGVQDSHQFLAMVYEVATVEYAQAVPFERILQGEQVDAAEALFAVGDTVDRGVTWPSGIRWASPIADYGTVKASRSNLYTFTQLNSIIYGSVLKDML